MPNTRLRPALSHLEPLEARIAPAFAAVIDLSALVPSVLFVAYILGRPFA